MSALSQRLRLILHLATEIAPPQSQFVGMKGRFVVNPFPTVPLAPSDQRQLHDLAISLVKAGLERYTAFVEKEQRQVDLSRWKLVKSRENARVFMEKSASPRSNGNQETRDLPSLLCVGTTAGQLEDLMFGVVNPTLEVMRIKASYVDDLSGAAVLATVEEPTLDEPFKSLVVKWMELDIPLHTTNLVKNRDYIYAEATDILTLPNGDRVGYHLLHSINFPQTHELPNRIRGNLSICGFFRQITEGTTEIYVTGIMDPAGGLVRHLVIPEYGEYLPVDAQVRALWTDEEACVDAGEEVQGVSTAGQTQQEGAVRDVQTFDHGTEIGRLWQDGRHVQALLRLRVPQLQDPQEDQLHHARPAAGQAERDVLRPLSGRSEQIRRVRGC